MKLPAAIRNEVITGLQKLAVLRMPGTPAQDTLKATAVVWIEALEKKPVMWDEALDTWRVAAAFTKLVETSDRWPLPYRFFELLPSRKPAMALPHRLTPEERAEGRKRIANAINTLAQAKTL